MKRLLTVLLAVLMLLSAVQAIAVSAEDAAASAPSFKVTKALYVHAVSGSADTEAWHMWQSAHDEKYNEPNPNEKFFFLPSSAGKESVDVYNGFDGSVTINGVAVSAGEVAAVPYEPGKAYKVSADKQYTLTFMNSGAEAAVFVNNTDADGEGTPLMDYLNSDKSLSAKASGAIVTPDGAVDNTAIKKIKGRGNTTWGKAKKPYNITYDSKVSIAGMAKSKKYSLLANYQDDSLSRNRILYDLSDAVGMPYASDSRYVDFYSNGYYWGSFLMTEKVEAGSSSLVSDFEEDDYLDESGEVKTDFPFLCEVDASAAEGEDYYVSLNGGLKITIKAPELEPADKGYNEVKQYVKEKFTAFYDAVGNKAGDISAVADVDSVAKIFLINELGKNWDAGVSSLFFTYKQDSDGKFKFYGSPVWDFDNSLGNAVGVGRDLQNIGVTDYEEPTGKWCEYKGKGSGRKSSNIMTRISVNNQVAEAAKIIWFEKFVPAIDHFAGKAVSEELGKDLYTADEYYNLIKLSAEMNYKSGWLLNTGSWIADHSRLTNAYYDSAANEYQVNKYADTYVQDFTGMFNYACDWMITRAAWMSAQYGEDVKTVEVDNTPDEPVPSEKTEPASYKLSKTKFVYSGKVVKPSVTVKDSDGNVISAENYTVKYSSGRKNVGKYTVKVTMNGDYTGSKTLSFKIVPKVTSIKKLTPGKKLFKAQWAKTAQTTGYQLQYSTSSKFTSAKTKTVKSAKTLKLTVKKLKAKKTYYVRVRSYKTVSGTKFVSAWSKSKKVKTK